MTDAAQSDLVAGTNGNIVLVAGGTVTLNNGTANTTGAGIDGTAVSANGAGSVLIDVNTGNLVVNSDIISGTGHITLKAATDVLLGSGTATLVDISTGTAGTISLDAEGGALTMAGDANVTATASSARLNAASNVTLGNVTAANVSILADTGAIINATGSSKNVTATNLRLAADDAIGAAGNHLSTNVGTVTALSTGTDTAGIFMTEDNAVSVDTVTVSVSDFSATATTSTVTDAAQSDLVAGTNGNIVLRTIAGSITLNDGIAAADNTAISANGTGSVLLQALGTGSDMMINANIVSTSGAVTIFAADVVTLSSVIVTTGEVKIDTSVTGTVVFSKPESLTGSNQDINVVANSVQITTPLASDGGSLLVTTLTSGNPTSIVIGGADPGGVLHLGLDEVNLLQPGFADITLGNAQANQSISLIGSDGTTATPVVFNDPLIINAGGVANSVAVSGGLTGTALTVVGSLATTTLTAADISMVGNVTVNGLIEVATGATVITAGNTVGDLVTGSLTITGNIAGVGGANETLALRSESDVLVTGTISGIDALTVTAANNVTFNDTVAVTGNLVVNATGAVKFDKSLTLTAGGTLTIQGASSVEFASGAVVQVDGNLTIDAQTLTLLGGADSLKSTVPNSTLTLTSASTSNNIMIGSTVGQELAGALNLTTRDVLAIGSGFGNVVIGEAGLGAITVVGNTDLTSIVGTGLEVLGNTITVDSSIGGAVQVAGAVKLNATGNIVLGSGISTVSSNTVAVSSTGGNIAMASGTRLESRGGDVQISAVNAAAVSIATINARSGDLSQQGVVDIRTGGAVITDANMDAAADIFAKAINLSGYGPVSGSNGDVLEAVAEVVRIDVPGGSVLRHSDVDGRTYFDVVRSGQLYQQIVVVGNVTRVTEDPATLLPQGDAALIAAGLPLNSSLLAAPVPVQSTAALFAPAPQFTSSTAVSRYLAPAAASAVLQGDVVLNDIGINGLIGDNLLSDSSYGLASRLQQSYILGTPGEQPLISGLDTFSQDNFEYWVDTLSL